MVCKKLCFAFVVFTVADFYSAQAVSVKLYKNRRISVKRNITVKNKNRKPIRYLLFIGVILPA